VLADLVEKVRDYRATRVRVPAPQVPQAIAEALTACGAASAVLPTGVPAAWAAAVEAGGIRLHTDEPTLSHQTLNGIDAGVTGAAVAMADSGTIALDHSEDQGRRALSLLPDVHVRRASRPGRERRSRRHRPVGACRARPATHKPGSAEGQRPATSS
jgi:L-lactate dehydrogenase complex protein LldG